MSLRHKSYARTHPNKKITILLISTFQLFDKARQLIIVESDKNRKRENVEEINQQTLLSAMRCIIALNAVKEKSMSIFG